ncbi:nuclear transport factor 2 family protein [Sphingosinicella terrae]|uniref:nuclear transport factor 2 family protein n=1 Tax=Sphingosinicella terrae TaxID=2172047 RepID=UPI0013B46629|nr:nuclear transport factor 2 family protein [Sphingosinicella terrae]
MKALAALLIVLAAPAPAELVSTETLREVADRFDGAQIAQDQATLEAMTAPDLVFVGSDGARQDRAGFIAGWMDPQIRFEPVTITDRYILPLGEDAGIVGGETVLRGTAGGRPFTSRIRFADTFRRIDGAWRAVHIQATRVPEAEGTR